ncbi:MAG: type II toxin-antitoxin system prevent-host-death family antitoxin [Treponemataceae bacterium]|nr:type II toxin-antitoxin system prevent-host-death family antitoxin [Treponemataceae bacterium]
MPNPNYDNVTAAKLLNAFVPISRLNKGEAGKIIEEVKKEGIRVIVKNNVPECVIINVEEYDRFVALASRTIRIDQTEEEEEKRKAFIQRIRQNVAEPVSAVADRKTVMDQIGPLGIDEEAVNELRRLG